MSKIHPAVGHFLTAAKELDLFDEALALISGGGNGGGGKKGGKRHVSAETRAKIAAAQKKRWSKEKKGEKS
jgi:hypothetical protein